MTTIIDAQALHKQFGKKPVLKSVNLSVEQGEIIGLVGPNGAGKTTLLKSILGLAPIQGHLQVLGLDPKKRREALMERVSFIADTAILPSWIRIEQALQFIEQTHPRFNKEKALSYLENTNIPLNAKAKELSKGMLTKAHLSMIMAIDSELLILDEPTLGLDIVKRKEFYQQLLGDYFDGDKTVVITTHQVEEIENIITRAVFIDDGEIVLDETMESIQSNYYEVTVDDTQIEQAETLQPLYIDKGIRDSRYIYKCDDSEKLSAIGTVRCPSLADLFVAKVAKATSNTASNSI